MGVYKRGDTWGISYFLNGKRYRKANRDQQEKGGSGEKPETPFYPTV